MTEIHEPAENSPQRSDEPIGATPEGAPANPAIALGPVAADPTPQSVPAPVTGPVPTTASAMPMGPEGPQGPAIVPPTAVTPTSPGGPTADGPYGPGTAQYPSVPGYVTPGAGGWMPPPQSAGEWSTGWYGAGNQWAPPATSATPSKAGRAKLAGAVALGVAATLVVGAVIGHSAFGSNATPTAAPATGSGGSSSGGSSSGGSSSGGSSTNPFGGGSSSNPLGGGSGTSSGSNLSGNAATNAAIAAKVDPGLVDINTDLSYQGEAAAGTGIVLTSNGEILTNNHVIDGATSISVTDIGNGKTYNANVVGYDRTSDVAVIQLVNASGLTTANVGNSSSLNVGTSVVGIGNAGGAGGKPSTAGGTVTALNQAITASDDGGGNSENLTGLIETDANIQPGDSGGALVTTDGTVIGMDTAANSSTQFQSSSSQSYAIPINSALGLAQKIDAHDASTTIHIGRTAFLGVEVQPASSAGSSSGGLGFGFGGSSTSGGSGSSSSTGANIVSTVSGGPAANGGLADGDTITTINGTTVDSPSALTTLLLRDQPGQTVTIGYTDSSGNSQTASVTLGSGPPQ